ncbi:MAG: ion transporter [Verrucomicrobiales bacterium]|nr:ion transporter [Verrucomicrobiales bacterium]MCP5526521.1 ion transporter [Verrucomicrobiales bacterium]
MKARLDRWIRHTATELTVGALIILSVVLIVLERLTPADDPNRLRFEVLGDAITALFVIELSIRWYVARSSRFFWREYWLDALSTVPLIRPLRMLRVLRLLRLIPLGVRISRRTRRLGQLFHEGLAQNIVVAAALLMILLFGAVGINVVEGRNPEFSHFDQAVWWSLFTMMAGEPIGAVPTTWAGRLVTLAVMLGGFTLFAMFTGIVSAVMVARLRGGMEVKEMEIDDLTDHYLICGWNRSAPRIIQELQADRATRRHPIVIVAELDHDPELPRSGVNRGLIFFIRADYTSADVLRQVRVEHARRAILLADKSKPRSDQDRDARTVLAALTIEKLHRGIHTCVELLNRDNGKVLELAGVEEILVGDEYMGNLIAHSTRTGGLVRMLDELLSVDRGSQFYRMAAPADFDNLTVGEAITRLKAQRNLLLVGVEPAAPRPGRTERLYVNPPAELVLRGDDHLLVIGCEAP